VRQCDCLERGASFAGAADERRAERERERERERRTQREQPKGALCTSATNGVIPGACLSVRVAQTTERAVIRGGVPAQRSGAR